MPAIRGWAQLLSFATVKSAVRRGLGSNWMPMFFSKTALLNLFCFFYRSLLKVSSFLIFFAPFILVPFLMTLLLTFNISTSPGLPLFSFLPFLLFLFSFLGLLSFSLELQITRVAINLRITEVWISKPSKQKHVTEKRDAYTKQASKCNVKVCKHIQAKTKEKYPSKILVTRT